MRKNSKTKRGKFNISKLNPLSGFRTKYWNQERTKSSFNIYIFLSVVLIGIIGVFTLLSASAYLNIKYAYPKYYFGIRQLIFMISGIIIMLLVSKVDPRFYRHKIGWLYGITLLLLFLVFVPGVQSLVNGAKRAIKYPIPFMPSDIAKPVLIMMIAYYTITTKNNKESFISNIIGPAFLIGLPVIMVAAQPDLSTSITILVSSGFVYLNAGFNSKYKYHLVGIGILILFVGWKVLKPYQLERIVAFLDPEAYYNSSSWQVLNGLFAVTRGGVDGVGYGKSIYKHGYLSDEVNNDMIFAVFAEERGFIGSVLLILFILLITYITIKEAMRTRDEFLKLVCFGIAMVYFVQSMINIGVSLSVIPNTGITLPFISNGGTSIVMYYAMFGIVLAISRVNNFHEIKEIKQNNRKNH